MKEIILQDMSKQEAYELDRKLAYCAEMALHEASEDKDENDEREDVPVGFIYDMVYCYTNSMFAWRDREKDDVAHAERVKERLHIELNRRYPSDDQERQDLLLPIMAYALIISNEYNQETVKKRIDNDSERPKPKTGEYPYNKWKHVDPFVIKRSDNPPKNYKYSSSLNKLISGIAEHPERYKDAEDHIVFAYAMLKNYKDVAKCQDVARIALFLRSVLFETFSGNKPMDTLIRMYLANHLDNILFRSYSLCEDGHYEANSKKLSENGLLRYYYDSEIDDEDEETFDQDIIYLHQRKGFSDAYKNLVLNYTISENQLNSLINFYLDEAKLNKYAGVVSNIEEYTDHIVAQLKDNIVVPNAFPGSVLGNYVWYKSHEEEFKQLLQIMEEEMPVALKELQNELEDENTPI